MENGSVVCPQAEIEKILAAACPQCALLYLYRKSGRPMENAKQALKMSDTDYAAAVQMLSALGITEEKKVYLRTSELPDYQPQEVAGEIARDEAFSSMIGQIQRRLGRLLSMEEVKIFLGIYRQLGLDPEVISVLVGFCAEKNAMRGRRMPSISMIEKEAYHWSELGIETIEQAVEHMQAQLQSTNRETELCKLLQMGGRKPTASEEKYLQQWIAWGFTDEVIALAYERTCLNAGGLRWPYMNAILNAWHEKNLMTPAEIAQGDSKAPTQKPAAQKHDAALSELEKQRIEKMMKKGLFREG